MHILFHSVFWGALIIIFGLSIIIKAVFKIDIPIFRIFFGLLLLYWGFKMVFGSLGIRSSENTVIFNNHNFRGSELKQEYNIVFGSSSIDLNNVDLSQGSVHTKIDVVFGSAEIYINPEIPALIKVDNVFADTKMPHRSISFFGSTTYKTPAYVKDENFLKVSIDVVFGTAQIIE